MNLKTLTHFLPCTSEPLFARVRKALYVGAACWSLSAAGTVEAQVIYAQDFNAAGATPTSVGWSGGYVYSGGNSDTRTITPTGVDGSGGLVTSVNITDGPNLSGYTEYADYTLNLPAGANPLTVSLTANITGSRTGAPFALIFDDHMGHQFVFNGRVNSAGTYQTVGGRLATADAADAAFDFSNIMGYSITLTLLGDAAWGQGNASLTLDNVILKTVPAAGPVYKQDFDLAGATAGSVGWTGGFIYAGGDYEAKELTPTGVGGSGGLVTTINVTNGPNLGAFTEYWSGTLKLPPGADAYSLALTADVTGSQTGAPFSLKLNDHAGHYATFSGTIGSAGTFQRIGGRLNTGAISSAFDFAGTGGYSIILSFDPSALWANGTNTLTIDNVKLELVARVGTNYAQNFNAAGATPSSVGWNGGFAYSGGSGATKAITATGVGGSGALVTSVNVTDGASLGAFTEYWSGTLRLPGASSPETLMLTAQVTANQSGVPFSLRFNDHATPTSHYITFTSTVANAGTFQPVGGRLSSANTVDPNFDFASTNGYSLLLTFNPSANWATGTDTLTIDNVVLQTVGPVSEFPLTIAPGSAGQAVLSWSSIAGRDYAVQFRDSLTGGTWFNIASPVRASGTTTSYTLSTTGRASRFYRIEAQ